MRYLSQLARETSARVIPARRPSWLHPTPALIEETVVEWPAKPMDDRRSVPQSVPQSAVPPFPTPKRDQRSEVNEKLVEKESSIPFRPLLALSTEAMEEPADDLFDSSATASRSIQKLHIPEIRSFSVPSSSSRALNSPSQPSKDSNPPMSDVPANVSMSVPATLQSVLSEMERRQQRLEEEYQTASRISRREPETYETKVVERLERETHEVRLNIGSIVVQVEPEPSIASSSQRIQKNAPPAFDNSWKRSFLDRY